MAGWWPRWAHDLSGQQEISRWSGIRRVPFRKCWWIQCLHRMRVHVLLSCYLIERLASKYLAFRPYPAMLAKFTCQHPLSALLWGFYFHVNCKAGSTSKLWQPGITSHDHHCSHCTSFDFSTGAPQGPGHVLPDLPSAALHARRILKRVAGEVSIDMLSHPNQSMFEESAKIQLRHHQAIESEFQKKRRSETWISEADMHSVGLLTWTDFEGLTHCCADDDICWRLFIQG